MKALAILGASGHGRVVADIAEQIGWQQIVFFDDAWPDKTMLGNWMVSGKTETLLKSLNAFTGVFVAIGDNGIRKQKLELLSNAGVQIVSLIHPSAIVSHYASIGLGVVVMPGVVVNAETRIGFGTILNTHCTVDHECDIGNAVHISPGAHLAGNVSVGGLTWVGMGACISQGAVVGSEVVVGAGAVVIADIPSKAVALGIPAKY